MVLRISHNQQTVGHIKGKPLGVAQRKIAAPHKSRDHRTQIRLPDLDAVVARIGHEDEVAGRDDAPGRLHLLFTITACATGDSDRGPLRLKGFDRATGIAALQHIKAIRYGVPVQIALHIDRRTDDPRPEILRLCGQSGNHGRIRVAIRYRGGVADAVPGAHIDDRVRGKAVFECLIEAPHIGRCRGANAKQAVRGQVIRGEEHYVIRGGTPTRARCVRRAVRTRIDHLEETRARGAIAPQRLVHPVHNAGIGCGGQLVCSSGRRDTRDLNRQVFFVQHAFGRRDRVRELGQRIVEQSNGTETGHNGGPGHNGPRPDVAIGDGPAESQTRAQAGHIGTDRVIGLGIGVVGGKDDRGATVRRRIGRRIGVNPHTRPLATEQAYVIEIESRIGSRIVAQQTETHADLAAAERGRIEIHTFIQPALRKSAV